VQRRRPLASAPFFAAATVAMDPGQTDRNKQLQEATKRVVARMSARIYHFLELGNP